MVKPVGYGGDSNGYKIQRGVGIPNNDTGFRRREEAIITRLRIGHTALSGNLHKIKKMKTS